MKKKMNSRYALFIVDELLSSAPIISTDQLPEGITPNDVQEALETLFNPENGYLKEKSDQLGWFAILDQEQCRVLLDGCSCSQYSLFSQILYSDILEHVKRTRNVSLSSEEFNELVSSARQATEERVTWTLKDIKVFIDPANEQGFLGHFGPSLIESKLVTPEQLADLEKFFKSDPSKALALFQGFVNSFVKFAKKEKQDPSGEIQRIKVLVISHNPRKTDDSAADYAMKMLSELENLIKDIKSKYDSKCNECDECAY